MPPAVNEETYLTPKERFEQDVKMDVQAQVREGVKAVLEEVLEGEVAEHLKVSCRGLTSSGAVSVKSTTPETSLPLRARDRAFGSAAHRKGNSSPNSASATCRRTATWKKRIRRCTSL